MRTTTCAPAVSVAASKTPHAAVDTYFFKFIMGRSPGEAFAPHLVRSNANCDYEVAVRDEFIVKTPVPKRNAPKRGA